MYYSFNEIQKFSKPKMAKHFGADYSKKVFRVTIVPNVSPNNTPVYRKYYKTYGKAPTGAARDRIAKGLKCLKDLGIDANQLISHKLIKKKKKKSTEKKAKISSSDTDSDSGSSVKKKRKIRSDKGGTHNYPKITNKKRKIRSDKGGTHNYPKSTRNRSSSCTELVLVGPPVV